MTVSNKTNVKKIRAFLCRYIYAYFIKEDEIIYSNIVFNPKIVKNILPFLKEEFGIEAVENDICGFYSIATIDAFINKKLAGKIDNE